MTTVILGGNVWKNETETEEKERRPASRRLPPEKAKPGRADKTKGRWREVNITTKTFHVAPYKRKINEFVYNDVSSS